MRIPLKMLSLVLHFCRPALAAGPAAILALAVALSSLGCSFHVGGQAKTAGDANGSSGAKSSARADSKSSARVHTSAKGDAKSNVSGKSNAGSDREEAKSDAKGNGAGRSTLSVKIGGRSDAKGSGKANGRSTSTSHSSHTKTTSKSESKVVFKSSGRAKGVARSKKKDEFKAGALIKGRGSISIAGHGKGKGSVAGHGDSGEEKTASKPTKTKTKTKTKHPSKPATPPQKTADKSKEKPEKHEKPEKTAAKPKKTKHKEKPAHNEEPQVPVEPIDPPDEAPDNVFGYETPVRGCFEGIVYPLAPATHHLPTSWDALEALSAVYACEWDIPIRDWSMGFPGVDDLFEWFAIRYTGSFNVEQAGMWTFRISSDDGAKLFIDGKLVIDNDGEHPPQQASGRVNLSAGDHEMVLEYFQGPRYHINLQLFATPPDGSEGIFSVR